MWNPFLHANHFPQLHLNQDQDWVKQFGTLFSRVTVDPILRTKKWWKCWKIQHLKQSDLDVSMSFRNLIWIRSISRETCEVETFDFANYCKYELISVSYCPTSFCRAEIGRQFRALLELFFWYYCFKSHSLWFTSWAVAVFLISQHPLSEARATAVDKIINYLSADCLIRETHQVRCEFEMILLSQISKGSRLFPPFTWITLKRIGVVNHSGEFKYADSLRNRQSCSIDLKWMLSCQHLQISHSNFKSLLSFDIFILNSSQILNSHRIFFDLIWVEFLCLTYFRMIWFDLIWFDLIWLYVEVMNHSDNQNKFDIEMNHSFPFNLLIQNESGSANEKIVKSEKNKKFDWDCKHSFNSPIYSSSSLIHQFINWQMMN
jgi:hypothetical protein